MPPIPERYRITVALLLFGLTLAGLVVLLLRLPGPRDEIRIVRPTPTPAPTELVVHVAGAVVAPGVYRLPPGDRTQDAIQAAGGPATDADPDRLNLAAPLRDGQQVVVPRRGEAAPTASRSPTSRPDGVRLNLNTASAAELDTLPGIGPALSTRILEHRERNGPFHRVEELRDLKLVPTTTFERIKDLIAVP